MDRAHVRTDREQATRFVDHREISDLLSIQQDGYFRDALPSNHRRSYNHWRTKTLRSLQAAAARVRKQHGAGFERQWATHSLRARAQAQGLSRYYDFYRVASAITHGSGGGALGLRHEFGPTVVIRTGPAVQLAPYMFSYGLDFFARLLDRAATDYDRGTMQGLRDNVAAMREHIGRFALVALDIDRQLHEAAPEYEQYPVVRSRSKYVWVTFDRGSGLAIESEPVDIGAAQRYAADIVEAAGPTPSSPAVYRVERLCRPKPGESWVRAGRLLPQKPLAVPVRAAQES